MNSVVGNATSINNLTDQVITSDLLVFAKTGVKTYAAALTESITPAVKTVLKKQLDEAIAFQDKVSSYMMQKGWYNAYDMKSQIQMDLTTSQNTVSQIESY